MSFWQWLRVALRWHTRPSVEEPLSVWAVVFSNYEPSEVDSLWRTEQGADMRAGDLGDEWGVTEWEVRG